MDKFSVSLTAIFPSSGRVHTTIWMHFLSETFFINEHDVGGSNFFKKSLMMKFYFEMN